MSVEIGQDVTIDGVAGEVVNIIGDRMSVRLRGGRIVDAPVITENTETPSEEPTAEDE